MADTNIVPESLVELCAHTLPSNHLRTVAGGNRVIRIPEFNVVVKSGGGVTEGEAVTQRQVCSILDPAIIYVPQVYHFYHDKNPKIGHILMEYVEGEPINEHSTAHIEALRKALDHLASFKRGFPGPLHSSEPQGILWEDETPSDYNTLSGLED